MKSVTIEKDALLLKIKENRDRHRSVFEKALAAYQAKTIVHLERCISDLRDGRQIDHFIRMPIPEDHTSDYDRVITMLEMDIHPTVEVTEMDFRCYVMDEWDWSKSFAANTVSYVSS